LAAESDVILRGRLPKVNVFAEGHGGSYNEINAFTVLGPAGRPIRQRCDKARRPRSSQGVGTLNFECDPVEDAGIYTIHVAPGDLGLVGQTSDLRMRVLTSLPPSAPAPRGWRNISLAADPSAGGGWCQADDWYDVTFSGGEVSIRPRAPPESAKVPKGLENRLSRAHASVVRYVFEDDAGWILMFDHGEFGGGIEWYSRAGGEPRSIVIGDERARAPQNVIRAAAVNGVLYVLQGLSHGSSSAGQLAKLWHEHAHFTTHVIARYDYAPFDWIRESDGTWLVATEEALWRTSEHGTSALVARMPGVVDHPGSLVRSPDGMIYVGAKGGVLRLTPRWPEMPRYAPDWWVPAKRKCD
jgi:hypothetical protein